MLDRDLAERYEVETRVLNQAVNRNIERFPEVFMFQLTSDEFEIMLVFSKIREILLDTLSMKLDIEEINQPNIENKHRVRRDFTTGSVFPPGQLPGNKEFVTRTLFH